MLRSFARAARNRAFRNRAEAAAGQAHQGDLESGGASADRRASVLPVLGRRPVLPTEKRDTGSRVGPVFGNETVSPLFRRAPSATCQAEQKINAERHYKSWCRGSFHPSPGSRAGGNRSRRPSPVAPGVCPVLFAIHQD